MVPILNVEEEIVRIQASYNGFERIHQGLVIGHIQPFKTAPWDTAIFVISASWILTLSLS